MELTYIHFTGTYRKEEDKEEEVDEIALMTPYKFWRGSKNFRYDDTFG